MTGVRARVCGERIAQDGMLKGSYGGLTDMMEE